MSESGQETGSEKFFIARQPIFDTRQKPCAFEILYRNSGAASVAKMEDPDMATLQMIAEGFFLGRENGGSKPIFINLTEKMLREGHAEVLPAGKCVVEILEDIRPSKKNIEAVKKLRNMNYRIALDDFAGSEEAIPWLDYVDIVKVDVLGLKADLDSIKEVFILLNRYKCTLLAEKVENVEIFKMLREMGFDLFQGFFFCKPEIIEGEKISVNEITKLKLLKELGSNDFEVRKVSELLHTDTTLSFRLFRYINSAGMGFGTPIKTLDRAVALLGQRKLIQWLRVLMLSDLSRSKKASEVVFTSVQRGRFLELMARRGTCRDDPETMFLLGMFSLLDTLLGMPMFRVLEKISLDENIKSALTGHKNKYWVWLAIAQEYEKLKWQKLKTVLEKLGLELKDVDLCYTEALKWAQQMAGQ